MVKRRRTYDKEFKLMAVELSESRSNSVKQVAKELDLHPDLIYQWRQQFKHQGERSFPGRGKKDLTLQEAEIAQLKKELRDAQIERDILKKAVSIFSKNDGRYSDS
ncbi:transposase [Bacteroidota bacterium]